jgi:hypothetical protein
MAATYLRCKCDAPVQAPTRTVFMRWVQDFYAASGMAALLAGVCGRTDREGCWWEISGDDDGATELSMLRGSARNTAGALEAVLLPYLCMAAASELRHEDCCHGDRKDALYAAIKCYKSGWDYQAPCPDCDPDGALRFLRYAYALFTECDWAQAYGGKAWAAIVEAAIVRLEQRYLERGRAIPAATAPRTGDRCPCHQRLYADAYGPKWALRCPNTQDNGPEVNVVRFCRKVEVFADYVLDLEHNTGSCLNKGWLHVDFDALHTFQDMKRNADPMEWAGAMYPRVAARVLARRPAPSWAAAPVKANAAIAPACDCTTTATVFGTTPKGSGYELTADPCPNGQAVVTGKYNGATCEWPTLVCGSMAAAQAYMDGLMAELVAKGTSAGKAWRASVKCPACGKLSMQGYACDCCPTDGPDGSDPLNPEDFTESSGSGACDPTASATYCAACDADPCTCTKSMTLDVQGCEVQITAYHGPTEGAPWPGKVEFSAEALPGEYDFSTPSIHTQVRCPSWADAKALWAHLTTKFGQGKCCHPLRATPSKLLTVFGKYQWPHAGGSVVQSLSALPSVLGLATWKDTVGGGCKATVELGGAPKYMVLASPTPAGGKVLVLDPDSMNVLAKCEVKGSMGQVKALAKTTAAKLVDGAAPAEVL